MSETRTFRATATHNGDGFWAEALGLPDGLTAAVQGTTPEETHRFLVGVISLLLDVPVTNVEVDLTFTPPTDVLILDPDVSGD